MAFRYSSEQWLPYPLEMVFAFFADPANLPRLMPEWQKARIDEASIATPPPHPNPTHQIRRTVAGAGTRLALTFRPVPLSPFRIAWDAEISEFMWNDHFCDIQLERGPFASWRHCHTLRAQPRSGTGGTLLRDVVEYTPPLGILGMLAQPAISLQLRYMFAHRHRRTAELLPEFAASLA